MNSKFEMLDGANKELTLNRILNVVLFIIIAILLFKNGYSLAMLLCCILLVMACLMHYCNVEVKKQQGTQGQQINECALTEEQAMNEAIFEAFITSPVPMCVLTAKTFHLVKVNKSMAKTFGYSYANFSGNYESINEKLLSWHQYLALCKELREQGAIHKREIACYNKDGAVVHGLVSVEKLDLSGKSYWLFIWHDITQLKHMETELKRLERLNAVSKMAVNLAHEVRNPMTTVRGFLQLMGKKNRSDCESIKMMISEIDSANAIITQFLFMAKERMTDFQLKDINSIINKVLMLVEKDAVKAGYLVTLQSGQIPMIMVDENQIKQMLLNIIRNGIEAMNDKGKLLIRTYVEEDTVVLTISDEGPGIAPEIVEQIGTPFFTTKREKSGLGLAVSYSIAERHGAKIKIDTSQKGTTFHIKFKTALGEC